MSSATSVTVSDLSAAPALQSSRSQAGAGGQQWDSQSFADLLAGDQGQSAPTSTPATQPITGGNNQSPTANNVMPDRNAPGSNGSGHGGTIAGRANGGGGSAVGSAKSGARNGGSGSVAGTRPKAQSDHDDAANASSTQTQPASNALAAPDAGKGAATASGDNSTPPQDDPADQANSPGKSDGDLHALAVRIEDALNRAKTGAATAADGTDKDGGTSGDNTSTSSTTDQGAAVAPQGPTAAGQPVAAAIVVAAVADSPATRNSSSTADSQGGRGKAAATAGSGAGVQPVTSGPKASADTAPAGTDNTAAPPAAGQHQAESRSGDSASASQAKNADNGSSAGGTPGDQATNASSNSASQQSQPQQTDVAPFTFGANGAQGSGRTGQADGAAASKNGGTSTAPAAGASVPSNGLLNPGVQVAPATVSAANAQAATASAVVPVSGLAVTIAAHARAGSNKFDIRLDPPELGRIDVRLDVDRNGQVTSHVTVDRADTLQLLQSQQPQLQRALEQAGLTTSDNGLQFTLRDQSFAGQNGSGGNSGQQAAHVVIPDSRLAPIDTTQIYSRWNLGGGLDIRV